MKDSLYKEKLSQTGAVQKPPLVFWHVTHTIQGLSLSRISTEQTISHVELFIHHFSSDSLAGHVLQMTLEKLQLTVVSGTPFLPLLFTEYGCLATKV